MKDWEVYILRTSKKYYIYIASLSIPIWSIYYIFFKNIQNTQDLSLFLV